MFSQEISISLGSGGGSSTLAISATSAPSAAFPNVSSVLVYADVACFCRRGSGIGSPPIALSTGVDQYIPATSFLRIGIAPGDKLAFITPTGTGNVWMTPGA